MVRKPLLLSLLVAATAPGQIQQGRVATDYQGSVIIFESQAALAGTLAPSAPRIFESTPAGVTLTAERGVTGPRTDDSGNLRAYSFYTPGFTSAIGGTRPPQYTGVVRHVLDGWEVRYPGRAGLSRDGRWAAFAANSPSSATLRVDLWTAAETSLPGGLDVTSIADDGSLVAITARSLALYTPSAEPRLFPLPWESFTPLIDRTARYAAVYGNDGLWRVNLATGELEPWVRQCNNCQTLDLGPGGSSILYRQWSILYLAGEPGSQPQRLTPEGQLVDNATLNGTGSRVIASTPDGIVAYTLPSGSAELVVPGPTSFTREPAILAPGLWVRQEGRGLSTAEIHLNGVSIEALRRSSSDLVWVVPPDTRPGPATVEIGQAQSPFAPAASTPEVQLAAPTFVLQADAEIGTPFLADWPIITHAATGNAVNFADPARPGESIDVVMTGVNTQGSAVEWLISKFEVDEYFHPVFESAPPAPENPNWSVVRLRMPQSLPNGFGAISAIYRNARTAARITTSGSALP